MTARARLVGAGLVLTAVLAASGCSQVNQITQEVAKQTMPTSIAVGECTNLKIADTEEVTEIGAIAKVPCDGAHGWETYAEKQFAIEDAFPGEAALVQQAEAFCDAEFATFIGIDYDDSDLDMQYLFPSETTWTTLMDRTITCLVGTASNDVVGTLRGSKQ